MAASGDHTPDREITEFHSRVCSRRLACAGYSLGAYQSETKVVVVLVLFRVEIGPHPLGE
jgi:hypothetical protein